MMDRSRQSSTSSQFLSIQIWSTKKYLGACLLLVCATASSSRSASPETREARESGDMFRGMTESPVTRIHRISNGRLNSRFLRTFPTLDFLHYARREGLSSHDALNGNSPVFYIRLPPTPYILVPGLGYVSPHPYNTPMIGVPPNPVMLNPLGMMLGDGGVGSGDDLSTENTHNNVISLPLTFLSNGRPAQIQYPKKTPSKFHSSKPEASKTTHFLSGGKYAFNGRPNAVFIVRSPSDGSPNSIL